MDFKASSTSHAYSVISDFSRFDHLIQHAKNLRACNILSVGGQCIVIIKCFCLKVFQAALDKGGEINFGYNRWLHADQVTSSLCCNIKNSLCFPSGAEPASASLRPSHIHRRVSKKLTPKSSADATRQWIPCHPLRPRCPQWPRIQS